MWRPYIHGGAWWACRAGTALRNMEVDTAGTLGSPTVQPLSGPPSVLERTAVKTSSSLPRSLPVGLVEGGRPTARNELSSQRGYPAVACRVATLRPKETVSSSYSGSLSARALTLTIGHAADQ